MQTDVENLSDHHHITFSYADRRTASDSGAAPGGRVAGRRHWGWSTARMDVELLAATVVVSEWTGVAWSPELPSQSGDAEHLDWCVTATCDVALPLRTPLP